MRGYAAATSAQTSGGDGGGEASTLLGGPIAALDAVVGQATIGVAVFDCDGRYLYVNETAARFSGIPAGAHVGRELAEVAPTAALVLGPLLARAAVGEVVGDVEVVGTDVDGRVRTSMGSLIPFKGDTGEVAAVVALFWEVTERLEAEAARRAVDERFRLLADAAPVLMWTMDATGRCDWLSGGWAHYVGVPVGEQLGRGWLSTVHPDDADEALAGMQVAFLAREPFDVEFRVRRFDGTYRWLLDRGVPRFDADGDFAGYVGTCTDIHERRLAQDRMAALQRVTAAFAQTLTPDDVAAAVVDHAVEATGASAGSLCLLGDDGVIRVARSTGYPDDVLDELNTFPATAELPLAYATRTGQPVLIDSVSRLPDGVWRRFRQLAAVTGSRAAAALPIAVDGAVVGALGLSFDGDRAFDASERDFLLAVAAQCSGALERASLYRAEQDAREAAERSRERLAFLAEAGRLLAGRLSREEILHRVTELAGARLAPWVALYLEQDGVLRRAALASNGTEEAPIPDVVPVVADAAVARCFRAGQPVTVELADDDEVDGTLSQVPSAVFAPVRSRSVTLGVLCLSRPEGMPRFTLRDVSVAVELAARAGLAVENADLYEQEHRVAETLQRAVLPSSLPDIPGTEVAARYLPAAAGMEVGGDWFDAFELRDGRIGVVIGDVAGHGLRAAAVMGQLRNALRAYAVDAEPPGVVLRRLSRLLLDERDAPFATAIYGVFDPADGRLVLANAGHPAPLLVRRDEVVQVGAATGPPLGVSLGEADPDVELRLDRCELLLLYTDGLVERRHEHLDAGIARLVRALADQPDGMPVSSVCDAVVGDVLRGAVQEDDVCILALRRS